MLAKLSLELSTLPINNPTTTTTTTITNSPRSPRLSASIRHQSSKQLIESSMYVLFFFIWKKKHHVKYTNFLFQLVDVCNWVRNYSRSLSKTTISNDNSTIKMINFHRFFVCYDLIRVFTNLIGSIWCCCRCVCGVCRIDQRRLHDFARFNSTDHRRCHDNQQH